MGKEIKKRGNTIAIGQPDIELIEEAKKYFPVCVYVDGKYRISKRLKGAHQDRVVKSYLVEKKIEVVFERYKNNAKNVVRSNTTKSIYFDIGSIPHRISNHYKLFGGNQIIIKWDTKIENL